MPNAKIVIIKIFLIRMSEMINKRRILHSTILGSLFLLGAVLLSACTGQPTTTQTPATPAATSAPTVAATTAPTTPAVTAPTTSSDAADWKLFTADKQFSINYPSAWKTGASDPLWSFYTGDSDATTQAVTIARNDTPAQDPQTMLALALPVLYGSGCKAVPVSQTIINGVPYATMTPKDCVSTATPTTQVLYVHLLQGSGSNFVFGCQAPTATYSAFKQTYCEPMIATFKAAA
jgi:hypothetical protein